MEYPKKEMEMEHEPMTLEEKYQGCDHEDDEDNMSSCPIGKFSNDRKKE